MATKRKRKPPAGRAIYIVSDGRGDTAEQVVRAAALQFEGARYRVVRKVGVRTTEQVESIVEKAEEERAVIMYTLVGEDTRRAIRRACGERAVTRVDILGPAFRAFHDLFQKTRGETPGLLYAHDRERHERMAAIDYTLKHDDGQRPHELSSADVVLVGVSRASKSSTCFYLAYDGVKAANVPLFGHLAPPPQLLKLPADKVVGLRVNVHRLLTIREARALDLGIGPDDTYLDKRAISREVLAANRIMDDRGWQSFDVSYMAIEEIAKEVTRLRGLDGPRTW